VVLIQGFNIVVPVEMHYIQRKQFNVTNLTSHNPDIKISTECVRGPLKMLWRATCGQRAINCPSLV